MTDQERVTPDAAEDDQELRRKAEAQVDALPTDSLSSAETAQLVHELQVHQVEQKMQNEELLRTQHELELARSRYFDLYNLAPVGYLTLSPQGLIEEVNLTVATMLCLPKKELLHRPFSRFIVAEDQDIYYLHRKQHGEINQPTSYELRLLCNNQAPFWAHLECVLTDTGECRLTLNNIDNRKAVEKALSESQERLQAVVMAARGGIIVQEQSGRITLWNKTAERIFGISAREACEIDPRKYGWQTYHEDGTLFPGTDHPSIRTLATGEAFSDVIMKVVRANGDYSWISINTSPLCRVDELFPYAVAITFTDITERKQAIRVLQARLAISDYAHGHSLDELLTKVLDEAEALTDSQIGFFHFVDPDQITLSLQTWSTNTLATFDFAFGKGKQYPLESAGVWADCIRERRPLIHNNYATVPNRKGLPPGHPTLLRELVVPIFRNNQIVAVMGIGNKPADYTQQDLETVQHLANLAWDIVKRKRSEDALAAKSMQLACLNQNLEQRIAESVQELRVKDEILIQQGRLAAMGEMINNIAHQWRQPLNNIGLIVQNLQLSYHAGSLTSDIINKDVSNTMQLLMQMSATIDDFRNFFSQEKVLQTFLINDAVQRSLNFMLPSLKNHNIKVVCDVQADITAEGYPGEYTQALLNILTNAKDALQERHTAAPCITIRIFSENDRSVITITDNAGGIAEEALPKIFDPYFSTKKKSTGTGIGLFMSKMIIERNMHGSLTACNTENGAEFRIEL